MSNKWVLAGLIALNLLLAGGVLVRLGGEKTARAQIGAVQSDYAIVAGSTPTSVSLYLLQLSSGRLAVLQIDTTNHRINAIEGRNIVDDFNRLNH